MTEARFLTSNAGFRGSFIPTLIKKSDMISNIKELNKGRHIYVETTNNNKYYFIYKRKQFLTLNQVFPHLKGQGESINVERLYWCLDHNVSKIIICYPNGYLYGYSPEEWLEFANKNNTYRRVKVKDIDKVNGKYVEREEVTVSIELSELKRFDDKYKKGE